MRGFPSQRRISRSIVSTRTQRIASINSGGIGGKEPTIDSLYWLYALRVYRELFARFFGPPLVWSLPPNPPLPMAYISLHRTGKVAALLDFSLLKKYSYSYTKSLQESFFLHVYQFLANLNVFNSKNFDKEFCEFFFFFFHFSLQWILMIWGIFGMALGKCLCRGLSLAWCGFWRGWAAGRASLVISAGSAHP